MYSTLVTNTEDQILTITINRPDKLNALNKTVLEELDHAIDAVYTDAGVKAVIITGSGENAFVAGADISEFTTISNSRC